MSKRGLGRGLSALLPETPEAQREAAQEISIERIQPNAEQPRRHFDADKLEELAASIREHGVVQPIVLRPVGDNFEIVAGERRWRASQLAGLKAIPALVRELTPHQVMEIALIENLQREDLSPVEEAQAFRKLIDEFGLTQDELARRLGKSRPQISNTLRVLQLQPQVQEQVNRGELTLGHAKAILAVEQPTAQAELARRVSEQKLTVRQTEEAARNIGQPERQAKRPAARRRVEAKPPSFTAVEGELRSRLATPVAIHPGQPKGTIEISFFGEEDLTRLVDLLLQHDVPRGT